MKKIVTALMIAGLALSFASCQKELENAATTGPGDAVVLTLNATHEVDTKTVLNGTTPKWAAGDKVTVMYKKTGESSWSSSISGEASSEDSYVTATFSTELTSPDGDQAAYAIYPANNLSQNVADKAKITIASTQHPTGTSFDGASDILISKSFNPTTSPVTTQFARLGAVLKISIDNATLASEKLVSLSVEGANPLAGDVLVGLSDKTVKDIENGSNTVTAEYETANQFELGSGKYVYLIVNPQTLVSGSHLIINGVTRNYTFTKDIVLDSNIDLSSGHIRPLNITISSTTLTAKKDVLTYDLMDFSGTSGSYVAWSGKSYSGTEHSDAVYAGQTCEINASDLTTYGDYVQIRKTSPSGIITTASGGSINKIYVKYGGKPNTDGRVLTIYGKNTAYTASSELYDEEKRGEELGTITFHTGDASGYLNVNGYYEYIGLLASGAMYFDNIELYWGNTKANTGIKWTADGNAGDAVASADAKMKTGPDDMPAAFLYNPNGLTVSYSSSDEDVATINASTGEIVLVGVGSTTISATFAGDATYRPSTVSYTLSVDDNRTVCYTPTFSPAAGTVDENTVVTISSTTTGSTIYYTTNGDTPVVGGLTTTAGSSGTATASVIIKAAMTIKAIAVKDDYQPSAVGSASYVLAGMTPLATPTSVTISAISDASFTASWSSSDSNFDWIISVEDTAVEAESSNVASGTTSSKSITESVTLTQGVKYYFYVKAKGDGVSTVDSSYGTANADCPIHIAWAYSGGVSPSSIYSYEKVQGTNKSDGYVQDNSTGIELYYKKKDDSALFASTPSSISLTVNVGGGSTKNPLGNSVIAYLVDASGDEIIETETVVTNKVESKDGKAYTVSIPVVSSAYGFKIQHTKESNYNVRIFELSMTVTK